MRPSVAYRRGVDQGRWESDEAQLAVLAQLDRIHDELLERERTGFLGRVARRLRAPEPVRGLYLWGGVGRGKTFLVDLFYAHLPLKKKRRIHYHRFMGDLHARIRALGNHSDPLATIAADCAQEFSLLCLDEFFISDIGDAMLLGRLLDQLFARGVTLVTTSNTEPSNLYRDGLQRTSFLPAIAALEKHCIVFEMQSPRDYRMRALHRVSTWMVPCDESSEAALREHFDALTRDDVEELDATLALNDRNLPVKAMGTGTVWFDFPILCEGPRSVADYIAIARRFHTVLLSNVPNFTRENEDPAYRFVLLVDELYDRGVKLIASAHAAPMALYQGRRVAHQFERTASRLTEMQSREYLERPHRP